MRRGLRGGQVRGGWGGRVPGGTRTTRRCGSRRLATCGSRRLETKKPSLTFPHLLSLSHTFSTVSTSFLDFLLSRVPFSSSYFLQFLSRVPTFSSSFLYSLGGPGDPPLGDPGTPYSCSMRFNAFYEFCLQCFSVFVTAFYNLFAALFYFLLLSH